MGAAAARGPSPKRHTPLSSRASAWRPRALGPPECEFAREALCVVMSVKGKLQAHVQNVDVSAGAHGWAILMWTRMLPAEAHQSLLELARVLLCHAADRSKHTFLLGSGAEAAIPRPHGFVATLCRKDREGRGAAYGGVPYMSFRRALHQRCLVPVHVIVHEECGSGSAGDRGCVVSRILGSYTCRTSCEHLDMVEEWHASMRTGPK